MDDTRARSERQPGAFKRHAPLDPLSEEGRFADFSLSEKRSRNVLVPWAGECYVLVLILSVQKHSASYVSSRG